MRTLNNEDLSLVAGGKPEIYLLESQDGVTSFFIIDEGSRGPVGHLLVYNPVTSKYVRIDKLDPEWRANFTAAGFQKI